MPNPDDASRKFFALGYLLVNATHMLELETHFLKDEIVCCGFDLAQLKLNLKNANEFRIKTVEPEFNRSRNAAKKLVFERLLDKLKKERLKQLAQQVGK